MVCAVPLDRGDNGLAGYHAQVGYEQQPLLSSQLRFSRNLISDGFKAQAVPVNAPWLVLPYFAKRFTHFCLVKVHVGVAQQLHPIIDQSSSTVLAEHVHPVIISTLTAC